MRKLNLRQGKPNSSFRKVVTCQKQNRPLVFFIKIGSDAHYSPNFCTTFKNIHIDLYGTRLKVGKKLSNDQFNIILVSLFVYH